MVKKEAELEVTLDLKECWKAAEASRGKEGFFPRVSVGSTTLSDP